MGNSLAIIFIRCAAYLRYVESGKTFETVGDGFGETAEGCLGLLQGS